MSEPIDKLLDLLLDLDPSVNPTNSDRESYPKQQQSRLNKPRKKLAFFHKKASVTKTVESKKLTIERSQKIGEVKNNTTSNSIKTSLNQPENNLSIIEVSQTIEPVEVSVDKVTEVGLDNRIQAISSAISNLKEPNTNDNFLVNSSEIVVEDWILQKEAQLNELAESLNNLIPLMIELLSVKVNDSQELILQSMIPVIDLAIQERSTQDLDKMSLAIARILPDAISQEIKIEPKSVGKAIAPELALSIEEQIRLDRNAISLALGSEMGKAIKAQIELEKDAMVDALYPVIGNTISKYLAEEIGRINRKIEKSFFSREGISRKIRAKMRGISEAELILQESIICKVQAIFLIQKDSGLIICDVQPDKEHPLESDLVAGMLTAIRSFANDCIISGSELSEIDYGNFQIILEAAGYCYIAVVISGQPQPEFRDRIRETLSRLVMQYGDKIENYEGDTSTIPPSVKLILKDLTSIETNTASEDKKKYPPYLFWLLIIFLASILLPWGMFKYRAIKAQRITEKVAVQLDSNPQLSVYNLQSQVDRENITMTGKVASSYLRNLAQEIVSEIAREEQLNLDNQIIAVDIPPDPTITAQEVTRVSKLLNELPGVGIVSDYQNDRVTVTGFILDTVSIETVTSYFSEIPGIAQLVFNVKQELPSLDIRIYFDSKESEAQNSTVPSKIDSIKRFLEEHPTLNLKVIGHSDTRGSKSFNQKLILERANTVYRQAIAQGINPNRLKIVAGELLPPDFSPNRPLWLSRCVRFEPFIPEKTLP